MDLTQKAFGKSDQTRCPARIGRKDERQSGEAVLENGALMTESPEPVMAMCRPDPGIVHTAERQMIVDVLDDGKVDACTAGSRGRQDMIHSRPVTIEHIKRQRVLR